MGWKNSGNLSLTAVFLFSCGPQLQRPTVPAAYVEQERAAQEELAFKRDLKHLIRLHHVYTLIRTEGAPFCGNNLKPIYGFFALDAHSFPREQRQVATRILGLGEGIKVVSVGPGSPAAIVGLRADDKIVNASPGKTSFQSVPGWSTYDLKSFMRTLDRAGDGPISLLVRRGPENLTFTIEPRFGCPYSVTLSQEQFVNAFSDGSRIYITKGMMRFIESDEELALVVSHELAHNALGHIDRVRGNVLIGTLLGAALDIGLAAGGVNSGGAGMDLGGRLGRITYSQEFEMEADYLALYFLARASFDISGTPDFYRRMGVEHPGSIQQNLMATHPSTPERAIAIQRAIEEINSKINAEQPLVPEKLKGTPQEQIASAGSAKPVPVATPSPPPPLPAPKQAETTDLEAPMPRDRPTSIQPQARYLVKGSGVVFSPQPDLWEKIELPSDESFRILGRARISPKVQAYYIQLSNGQNGYMREQDALEYLKNDRIIYQP